MYSTCVKDNFTCDSHSKGDFYIINFPILKPFLCRELISNQVCELLVPKLITNGFIEYRYAYRSF